MPELPEVETIRRQLAEELTGYRFVDVKTEWEKSFRPSFKEVTAAIKDKTIGKIDRQAKLLIFRLDNNLDLLFHLKMTGRLLVRKPDEPTDEYTRSAFTLKKGSDIKELRFVDSRKFGFVKLIKSKEEINKLLASYGPEPLKDLTLAKFSETLKSSSRPIKLVLMDQGKISGIGNIYVNDALWLAKINPKKPAKKLRPDEVKELFGAIEKVLKEGLKYGGASDQWYRQVHGEEGKYQEHFLVYGRNGEKCSRCGETINRIGFGGRGTFFCPKCQKENRER